MEHYVGLDVSLQSTSICIVQASGKIVWQGKAASEPVPLIKALMPWRETIALVGIEACPLSEWLFGTLTEAGFKVVCLETRHTQRFLSSRPNKTDRNDARGIADMLRLQHYRPVHVKSRASQLIRTTLIARHRLVEQIVAIEQTIRGLLRVHGIKLGATHRCTFAAKVELMLGDAKELRMAIEPLLQVRNAMRKHKVALDRRLHQKARQDEVCRRLMTTPGVGPIVSLAYRATIDDPSRFRSSKAVGASVGLTPRVYQSGEIDRSGCISRCGDELLRALLFEAANSHLRISRKKSVLKSWGQKLAKRVGTKKALVAVARKLAIILHRLWVGGTTFQHEPQTALTA